MVDIYDIIVGVCAGYLSAKIIRYIFLVVVSSLRSDY